MDLVRLVIDGAEVAVPAGTSVLEAAERAGIHIPRLCYDRELVPFGACRLCVVEIEGMPNLPASCVTTVSPGMRVHTGTAGVVEARRLILELLLANHPQDCLTCEKTGNCSLAAYCYAYGVKESRFAGERRRYPVEEENPFIVRDLNKCILCGKCVRACGEITGADILDFAYRGFSTKATTFGDAPLLESDCIFCGNCVAVCPTGALTEKPRHGRGRWWELKRVRTTCPFCGTGCNFDLCVKDGAIVSVASNGKSPVNGKALCMKGRFGWDFVYDPKRLTVPLVKRNGRFEEASWGEALDLVARRLGEVKMEHGPGALAAIGSARCTNEENYLFQRFARAVLGTNSVDHCASTRHAPALAGLAASLGSGAMTNSINEIKEAGLLFLVGSNPTAAHPVIGYKIRQAVRRGAKLIIADPRRIELAGEADWWLRLKPGTDIPLLNGLAHIIIGEGLQDTAFVAGRTENFAGLAAAVRAYTPRYVSEVTGVPAEDLYAVARLYATTANAMIFYTPGISGQVCGTGNVASMVDLALLTGHLGRPGTGVNSIRGQNNVQGACDMGALPNVYPGYQRITDPGIRSKFEAAWAVPLSDTAGLTIPDMFAAAGAGQVKAMYIMGGNPVLSDPDAGYVKEGLARLEFLVVQELFLTETAEYADVVLPAASFAETDGTYTNTERRVQRVRWAIAPLSGRTNWQIIMDLCNRMGHPVDYESPREIFAEMASLTPSYAGISYDRLEEQGIQWPCPAVDHPGTPFLYAQHFARGLGLFQAVHHVAPAQAMEGDFARIPRHYNFTASCSAGVSLWPEELAGDP